MTTRYAISKIENVLIANDADTKASRYPVVEYVAFRRAATRDKARNYKRSRKNPQAYAIIDTATNNVVR